jgi:VWFA-related protein
MKSPAGLRALVASATALLGSFAVAALQDPAPAPKEAPPLAFQVGVDLIQIDAAITDKSGRPVANLRAEDFSVEVDGKKLQVSNATFFDGGAAMKTGEASGSAEARPASGRTLLFIVDDLNISFSSMYAAKRALKEFAAGWDEKEATVGLLSTSNESGSFRLFRSSERFLEAVEGVRFNIRNSKGATSTPNFAALERAESTYGSAYTTAYSVPNRNYLFNSWSDPAMVRANYEQRVFCLLSTINALRSVPGRKAVVVLSEGFAIGRDRDHLGVNSPFDSIFDDNNEVDSALRMITEVANRASVVLYTIDPSGLVSLAAGADVRSAPSPQASRDAWFSRVASHDTLSRLAEDTGGLSIYNRNDLRGGLNEAVTDQRAYYLIGFEPPKTAFAKASGRPKFHSIKLKVNRPDLRVRTRAGFYGVTDVEVLERAPLASLPAMQ